MNTPSIALCIPAYNAAACLPRLLQSAKAQTISFDEIWVYDDCSTDNTAEIAQQLGATVVTGETNLGCSHGKNVLAERTHCDWIHFHDADDELYPNFVEVARRWMLREDCPDVVLFDYEWRDEETNAMLSTRHFDSNQLGKDPISYAIQEQINPFCGLYRRSAYLMAGGYDTDPLVLYNEDVAFHCRMAIAGLTFAAEPTITIINYHRKNSMSAANQQKCTRAAFHVMQKVAAQVGEKYAKDIGQKLWGIAGISASRSDWKTARDCVSLAISLNCKAPTHTSCLFRLACILNPYCAMYLREHIIRMLKPALRQLPTP
ncbi:MAG: hypothetical protein DCF25_08845 [Leptolyngbya foveolarum]|uniref:Glycosyltransferase 2-like domain-containing protein n=1 Tax=Leptolyngbya foveolarum TaxID=47253 RepID=A0A2W4UJA4_9CYAN|nr:MAG: hypothetical protein DCF25_08845 [Leptolyngbya foveolarum]